MKLLSKVFIVLFFSVLVISPRALVSAQAGSSGETTTELPASPTPGAQDAPPSGVINGKIINQNDASKSVGDLEVMLHVVDQDQNQLGMLHGRSAQDGAYEIEDVPFQAGMGYVAAVAYEGTTYYSELILAEAGKTNLRVDIPVYESTTDLATVQVDQMHVLFNFAIDGLEVSEIYAISNLGDLTVKDGINISGESGARATVQFPLPKNAEFINFQPQNSERFIKVPGGFVDVAPLVPGQMVSQFMVNYLMPYTKPFVYPLKTVLPVSKVNLVVPRESGVVLRGDGLDEPQPITAQNGQIYDMYVIENLIAGKTLEVAFEGEPVIAQGQSDIKTISPTLPTQQPFLLGLGVVGAIFIGGGAFWWVRSNRKHEYLDDETGEEEISSPDQAFEQTLVAIAELDQRYEQGELDEAAYYEERTRLMTKVKALRSEISVSTEHET